MWCDQCGSSVNAAGTQTPARPPGPVGATGAIGAAGAAGSTSPATSMPSAPRRQTAAQAVRSFVVGHKLASVTIALVVALGIALPILFSGGGSELAHSYKCPGFTLTFTNTSPNDLAGYATSPSRGALSTFAGGSIRRDTLYLGVVKSLTGAASGSSSRASGVTIENGLLDMGQGKWCTPQ